MWYTKVIWCSLSLSLKVQFEFKRIFLLLFLLSLLNLKNAFCQTCTQENREKNHTSIWTQVKATNQKSHQWELHTKHEKSNNF
jgi:hypothetical protein